MGCFDMYCGLCGGGFIGYDKTREWMGHVVFTQSKTNHIQLEAKILAINTFAELVGHILPKDVIKIIANLVYFDTKNYNFSAKHINDIISSTFFEYDSYGRLIHNHTCNVIQQSKKTTIELSEIEHYNPHSRFAYHKSCWLICGKPLNGKFSPYKEKMFEKHTHYCGDPYILKERPELYWMFDNPLTNVMNRTRIVFAYMKSKCGYNNLKPHKFYKILKKKQEEID